MGNSTTKHMIAKPTYTDEIIFHSDEPMSGGDECRARIVYDTDLAEELYRSVVSDDDDYVGTELMPGRLIVSVRAGSVLSLLSALDDVLQALKTAETVIRGGGG